MEFLQKHPGYSLESIERFFRKTEANVRERNNDQSLYVPLNLTALELTKDELNGSRCVRPDIEDSPEFHYVIWISQMNPIALEDFRKSKGITTESNFKNLNNCGFVETDISEIDRFDKINKSLGSEIKLTDYKLVPLGKPNNQN
jgi:hypothetical protein